MKMILSVKGPVVTSRIMPHLISIHMNTDRFVEASQELEKRHLGKFVKITMPKGKPAQAFVKKPPAEARAILETSNDLCSIRHYDSRYRQPVSKQVNLNMRAYLANKGFISAKLLR